MKTYSLSQHFLELKFRIQIILFFFIITTFVCYYFSQDIYYIILEPLSNLDINQNKRIIYTNLTEAFFTYLKLSIFAGFLFTMPVIALQIYKFITPGLYKREKIIAKWLLSCLPILFYCGCLFAFYCLIPNAWNFFIGFESSNNNGMQIILEAKISEYLNLTLQLMIAFGISFELPIVLLVLHLLNLISIYGLKKFRRIFVVVTFIVSGILTPPDVLSQIMLAIPIILLYEVSINICKFIEK
ncbi:MAG: twin-arginine translocase subunit TatC [Rickettsiaceae bacterium]